MKKIIITKEDIQGCCPYCKEHNLIETTDENGETIYHCNECERDFTMSVSVISQRTISNMKSIVREYHASAVAKKQKKKTPLTAYLVKILGVFSLAKKKHKVFALTKCHTLPKFSKIARVLCGSISRVTVNRWKPIC